MLDKYFNNRNIIFFVLCALSNAQSVWLLLLCSFTSRLVLCKTPGCFLESLSNPGSSYTRSFKQNKEDLTSKLYRLYNTSVFDNKVTINQSVSLVSFKTFLGLSPGCLSTLLTYVFFIFVWHGFSSSLSICRWPGIRRCGKQPVTVSQGRNEAEGTATPALNCQRKSAILQVKLQRAR